MNLWNGMSPVFMFVHRPTSTVKMIDGFQLKDRSESDLKPRASLCRWNRELVIAVPASTDRPTGGVASNGDSRGRSCAACAGHVVPQKAKQANAVTTSRKRSTSILQRRPALTHIRSSSKETKAAGVGASSPLRETRPDNHVMSSTSRH
nr:hypothetical protein CFP56_31690 [Quercus suber]